MAFVGIDARTERTRHQVNYPETYDLIFSRLREELSAAKQQGQPIRHLIVLLGIPIAYPRLTWLENVFSSPFLGPLKLLNRRFGFGGGFFNHFDGSVDLLDDLDDHYTARTHKRERNSLIERLQGVCAEHSVRATILGGDVHLAAFGRFYSNPKLGIPIENDHRYIPNVISSAIVNKPPPAAVANLLARRNKIHHLNRDTDETLLKLFDKDPGESSKTAGHNNVTMPSRNFAIITENSANNGSHQQAAGSGATHLAPPGLRMAQMAQTPVLPTETRAIPTWLLRDRPLVLAPSPRQLRRSARRSPARTGTTRSVQARRDAVRPTAPRRQSTARRRTAAWTSASASRLTTRTRRAPRSRTASRSRSSTLTRRSPRTGGRWPRLPRLPSRPAIRTRRRTASRRPKRALWLDRSTGTDRLPMGPPLRGALRSLL